MQSIFRPLQPGTWGQEFTPASKRRSRWTFKAGWSDTVNLIDREVGYLGAKSFVIEADFREQDIRLDGMPRANARQPQFPGIRISFESKHGPLQYQSDICAFWQHNVRSIALGLEALRAVDRHGISSRAEQYTGFKALPSASPTLTKADAESFLWSVSGLSQPESWPIESHWKKARARAHPDRNAGDRTQWNRVEDAAKALGLL